MTGSRPKGVTLTISVTVSQRLARPHDGATLLTRTGGLDGPAGAAGPAVREALSAAKP